MPSQGYNSLDPADINFDQFKNTIKVNEITASGGTLLDGLRLGEAHETKRLNEIEENVGGINIGNLFSVYGAKPR